MADDNVALPLYARTPFFRYEVGLPGGSYSFTYKWSSLTNGFSLSVLFDGVAVAYSMPLEPYVNLFRGTSYAVPNPSNPYGKPYQLFLVGSQPTLDNLGVANAMVFGYGAVIP
jgi:hypothetical protein